MQQRLQHRHRENSIRRQPVARKLGSYFKRHPNSQTQLFRSTFESEFSPHSIVQWRMKGARSSCFASEYHANCFSFLAFDPTCLALRCSLCRGVSHPSRERVDVDYRAAASNIYYRNNKDEIVPHLHPCTRKSVRSVSESSSFVATIHRVTITCERLDRCSTNIAVTF